MASNLMTAELERRQMGVNNVPAISQSAAVTRGQTGDVSEQAVSSSSSSGETFQCNPQVDRQTKKKEVMCEGILYQKHSWDHPLLQDFVSFLSEGYDPEDYEQDVDNVARFLYYMNPSAPSLQCVNENEKTKQYFSDLTEAKVKKQTQVNNLKSIIHFVKFHTYVTDLRERDPRLQSDCKTFIGFLQIQLSICSKHARDEIKMERYQEFLTDPEKMANIVKVNRILNALCNASEGEKTRELPARSVSGSTPLTIDALFVKLVQKHPVTVDGAPPLLKEREAISVVHKRRLYEKWVKAQRKMRVQAVLGQFSRRRPSEKRVRNWMSSRGWKKNVPDVKAFIREWQPIGPLENALDSDKVKKHIRTQKWSGLFVRHIEGKGRGVVTTRDLTEGEIVCDYHGKVVSGGEEQSIHKQTPTQETGCMFFYTKNGQSMCIDARQESCECHPDVQTFGRLINHSRKKNANVRPTLYTLSGEKGETDVVMFFASRDIKANEEILYRNREMKV